MPTSAEQREFEIRFAQGTIPSVWKFKQVLARRGCLTKTIKDARPIFMRCGEVFNTHLAQAAVDPQTAVKR